MVYRLDRCNTNIINREAGVTVTPQDRQSSFIMIFYNPSAGDGAMHFIIDINANIIKRFGMENIIHNLFRQEI